MTELKKVLSFPVILLITVNSIVGTGIFFLPAIGAKIAGPASLISWAILALVSIYIAMCFGELSSMFPKSGGVYEFCKQAYGRFFSFIIGWMTFIAGNVTIAMLIVGAIQYLAPFHAPFMKISICLLFVFVFNFIAYKGMKTSAFMLVTFAFITLITIIGLTIPGLLSFNPGNFRPFFAMGFSSIFLAIFFVAETFFGWETATFLAEETKNPRKVMPKALIWGTVIIAAIVMIFVFSSLNSINWDVFGASVVPLSDLAKFHFGNIGVNIFTMLVYLAIIGSVAGWIVAAPRLVLALAEDKLFLPQFAKIHPKYFTPYKAIILQAILTSLLVIIGFGSYETLLLLLVPLVLIMYSAVLLSVVVLRIKKPKIKREFRTPFGKTGPVVVTLMLLAMVIAWVMTEHQAYPLLRLGISILSIGIPIYFLLEMYYNPRMIRNTNNMLAYFALFTERLMIPMKVRKEIIRLLGNIKGKTILEFGCSVGTLTTHLAEEVGKNGKIYATDISEKNIAIAKKRIDKKGHKHVKLFYDLQHGKRVHPKIPKIDIVVSIGILGYIQNIEGILKQLNKKMKKGNKICFIDYDKFFDIIPNKEWLSDDKKIRKIFSDAGFKVKVERKQGFAWKYVYIYGKKI